MKYTRRDISKLALSSAALATVPVALHARDDWAKRLEHGLNALIEDGTFKVTQLTQSGETTTAHITLTWPPGIRRRTVEAEGYEALETTAVDAFGDIIANQVARRLICCPAVCRETPFGSRIAQLMRLRAGSSL